MCVQRDIVHLHAYTQEMVVYMYMYIIIYLVLGGAVVVTSGS